jgi:hypothetical protein
MSKRRTFITRKIAVDMCLSFMEGESQSSIGRRFNYSQTCVSKIVRGKLWPDALMLAIVIFKRKKGS